MESPLIYPATRDLDDVDHQIREPIDGFSWRSVEGRTVLEQIALLLSGRVGPSISVRIAVGRHAFGIAVDINPSSNPSCGVTVACRGYNDLITDMPPEVVQAFKDAGFIWGGDWEDHPDPMHFEWDGWR